MPCPLRSTLSLLFIFSHFSSMTQAGNSRFYIVEQGCQGGNYVEFDIKDANKCYSLGSGTAGSLYSPLTNDVNIVSAFNRAHSSDCGSIECTINRGHTCCSSKHRRITGAKMNEISVPCEPLPACLKGINRLEVEERSDNADCTVIDDIGEPFVELADGTHFGLGIGKLGKLTAEELQADLEVKGQHRLSHEKIAELVEIHFIKSHYRD